MHTSLRHHSFITEREAHTSRVRLAHGSIRTGARRGLRSSLRDRIHATLRPGRRVAAYA
jgi:hypothetical protein